MTTITPGSVVDAGTVATLQTHYRSLTRAGLDSVRAAWRFGQAIDSFTDDYTLAELADSMELSAGTLYRYARLYRAYQRPELACRAATELETYDIGLIWQLANQLSPVEHARPYAGRRYRYRCQSCHSTEVKREEIDPAEVTA
jgi:hypothetical protein